MGAGQVLQISLVPAERAIHQLGVASVRAALREPALHQRLDLVQKPERAVRRDLAAIRLRRDLRLDVLRADRQRVVDEHPHPERRRRRDDQHFSRRVAGASGDFIDERGAWVGRLAITRIPGVGC